MMDVKDVQNNNDTYFMDGSVLPGTRESMRPLHPGTECDVFRM